MARIVVPEKVDDIPRILLIGDSGTHKTFFTGTLPRPYTYDFENGQAVTRDLRDDRDIRPASMTFKDAPKGSKTLMKVSDVGIHQWGKAYTKFLEHLNNNAGVQIDKGEWPHLTLGLDSLTTLGRVVMNHVMDVDNYVHLTPHQGLYHSQMVLMETLIDQLTAWPVIFCAIAHIQRDTNEITKEVEKLPLVTGKLAGKLGVFFSEVWYSEATGTGDQRKYKLVTESTGMYKQAKTRSNVPTGTEAHFKNVAPYLFPNGLIIEENGEQKVLVKPNLPKLKPGVAA